MHRWQLTGCTQKWQSIFQVALNISNLIGKRQWIFSATVKMGCFQQEEEEEEEEEEVEEEEEDNEKVAVALPCEEGRR